MLFWGVSARVGDFVWWLKNSALRKLVVHRQVCTKILDHRLELVHQHTGFALIGAPELHTRGRINLYRFVFNLCLWCTNHLYTNLLVHEFVVPEILGHRFWCPELCARTIGSNLRSLLHQIWLHLIFGAPKNSPRDLVLMRDRDEEGMWRGGRGGLFLSSVFGAWGTLTCVTISGLTR